MRKSEPVWGGMLFKKYKLTNDIQEFIIIRLFKKQIFG